jgi:hypothetical protein
LAINVIQEKQTQNDTQQESNAALKIQNEQILARLSAVKKIISGYSGQVFIDKK